MSLSLLYRLKGREQEAAASPHSFRSPLSWLHLLPVLKCFLLAVIRPSSDTPPGGLPPSSSPAQAQPSALIASCQPCLSNQSPCNITCIPCPGLDSWKTLLRLFTDAVSLGGWQDGSHWREWLRCVGEHVPSGCVLLGMGMVGSKGNTKVWVQVQRGSRCAIQSTR